MLTYHRQKSSSDNTQLFGQYYNFRKSNRGLTVVIFTRTKYADIYYDWDYDEAASDYKTVMAKFRANSNKIIDEISKAVLLYTSERKMKIAASTGKIFDIPIQKIVADDNADKLAKSICEIFEKYI